LAELPPEIGAVVDLFAALQTRWSYRDTPLGFGSLSLRSGISGDEIERGARLRGMWPLSEIEREAFEACVHVIREQDTENYQRLADSIK